MTNKTKSVYAWESIQKVVDHIEEHLAEEHSPVELAKTAALSPFYFQRLFTRLVRRPVGDYIKMRRLAHASAGLAETSRRIVDIALEWGFNSHESLTRAFKAAFGITPEEYRANPVHLSQIMKPDLLLGYTMIDENVPLITDDIVIEITRRKLDAPESYAGVKGKVPVSQATFGETAAISGPGRIWDDFHGLKLAAACFAPDALELGASMLNEDDPATFIYFAGAKIKPGTAMSNLPSGLTAWELPAGEYIVCMFEAENATELRSTAIDKALKYMLETWLPGHGLEILPFSAEKYTAVNTDGAAGMEIWMGY